MVKILVNGLFGLRVGTKKMQTFVLALLLVRT